MLKKGIAIFPKDIKDGSYLKLLEEAQKRDFDYVYTSLLSVSADDLSGVRTLSDHSDIDIIVDTDKRNIRQLEELLKDGRENLILRLDQNEKDLYGYLKEKGNRVCLNASLLIDEDDLYEKKLACHNFFPGKDTGLDRDEVLRIDAMLQRNGIETLAFVSDRKRVLLEEDRKKDIHSQIDDLVEMGVDGIFLDGDQSLIESFSSHVDTKRKNEVRSDLKRCWSDERKMVTIDTVSGLDETEERILFSLDHEMRRDHGCLYLRSNNARRELKGEKIREHGTHDLQKGDVIIVNGNDPYMGEIRIAMKDMKDVKYANVIGHADDADEIEKYSTICFKRR